MQKKRSFKYVLKKIGPAIERFGTPKIMSLKPQRHMDPSCVGHTFLKLTKEWRLDFFQFLL